MNKNETLDKIRENLKSLMKFSSELKQEVFADFDLTDGTRITTPATDLTVGAEVFALDDQQNQTPLDDGEYVLTDGRTITVKGNVIEAIADSSSAEETQETPAEEGAEPAEQEMSDGLPEDQPSQATDTPHDQIGSRIADLEKQVEDIMNIISKLGTTQGEVNEQMMSKLEMISEQNGDKPIKVGKREYNTAVYTPGKTGFAEELKDFLREKKNKK